VDVGVAQPARLQTHQDLACAGSRDFPRSTISSASVNAVTTAAFMAKPLCVGDSDGVRLERTDIDDLVFHSTFVVPRLRRQGRRSRRLPA
jgi:hypothetical protein